MHNLDRQRRWLDKSLPPTLVVGAGTIGSWLCEALWRCGTENVTVIDPDIVSGVNICSQNYKPEHIGQFKAEIAGARQGFTSCIGRLGKPLEDSDQYPLVFAVTDNLASRKLAGQYVAKGGLLVDVRLGRDLIQGYCVRYEELKGYYADAHALTDADVPDTDTCAKVSTITQSMISASLAVENAVNWHMGRGYNKYFQLCVSNLSVMAVPAVQNATV